MASEERDRALVEALDYPSWENTLEKLKVLNYESEFCSVNNVKPFTREYFAIPDQNPEFQFRSFEALVAWLLNIISWRKSLHKIDQCKDIDTSLNKMIIALKDLSFNMDFPLSHLKRAYGESTCKILHFLTDRALATKRFTLQPPEYVNEGCYIGMTDADDDADLGKAEDYDMEEEREEDEDIIRGDGMVISEGKTDVLNDTSAEQYDMLEAKVDPVEWNKELERVAPKLQAISALPSTHWYSHVEQTRKFESAVNRNTVHSLSDLLNAASEISEVLERVKTEERNITMKHKELSAEHKNLCGTASDAKKKHESAKSKSMELSNQLTYLTKEVEYMKEKLTDRGSKVHESSPLVQIKHVLEQMKSEIKSFDVRIGVASHSILSTKMRLDKETQGSLKKQVLGRDEQKEGFFDEEGSDTEMLE